MTAKIPRTSVARAVRMFESGIAITHVAGELGLFEHTVEDAIRRQLNRRRRKGRSRG